MFRVVADQLKISEGWVRCGHCADVFDATLYLQPWIPPGQENTPEDFVQAATEPEFEPRHNDELQGEDRDALPVDAPVASEWDVGGDEHAVDTLPPPVFTEAPAPPSAESDAEESNFQLELERFAAGLGRLSAARSGAVVSEEEVAVESAGMPDAPAPRGAMDIEFADSEEVSSELEPGFVRQARRQAFWQSPGMRVALSLLALVLAALLVAQWAVHERDRLAAWRPDLQPVLQRVCEPLGCTVAPLRRIDAIVIDSTSLVRRIGNFYSFDLVLKNTAAVPLAVPALELSLTDISDAVISRRVFLPDEWPDAPALLPAQDSVTVSFRLSLALGDTTPMAGYRALVFYP